MNKATLLTGDMDFKPLLDALVQEGMYTTLLHDPKSTSKELLYAADSNEVLSLNRIYGITTEDFKQRHPAPKVYSGPIQIFQRDYGSEPKKRGVIKENEIHLHKNEDEYAIINYTDKCIFIYTFSDLKILEKWAEYQHNGSIEWKK